MGKQFQQQAKEHVIKCPSSTAFGLTEKMLLNYSSISDEVNARKQEISYYKRGEYTGGDSTGHAYVQDPTMILATKTIEKIRIKESTQWEFTVYYPEDWLLAINSVLRILKKDKLVGGVITRKYFWNESLSEICKSLGITTAQYRFACHIGIRRIVIEAIKYGLLDIK